MALEVSNINLVLIILDLHSQIFHELALRQLNGILVLSRGTIVSLIILLRALKLLKFAFAPSIFRIVHPTFLLLLIVS